MAPLAPEKNIVPLNVLPPSRGMMLSITPPVSASPRPPDVVRTTSCEPATFETAAFELAPAHPVLMPSWSVRESDARAPWMKPAMPPLPPVMPPESPVVRPTVKPGMSAWMPLAPRDDGMAVRTSRSSDGLHARALDVHDGRLAGDRDRLFEAADAQVGVDRGHEVAA